MVNLFYTKTAFFSRHLKVGLTNFQNILAGLTQQQILKEIYKKIQGFWKK